MLCRLLDFDLVRNARKYCLHYALLEMLDTLENNFSSKCYILRVLPVANLIGQIINKYF